MIPVKSKEILKRVAKESGYDTSYMEDAVSFFWSDVRKHLSELTFHSITIPVMGRFMVKHWRIDEYIANYQKHLSTNTAYTFKTAIYRNSMRKQYKNFLRLKKEFEKELVKKDLKKEEKRQYELAKTMGEQVQNNGGSSKQCDKEG